MIIKRNIAAQLPVILTDDTDFKTPETSVLSGSVICNYAKEGDSSLTTKDIVSGDVWTELGMGLYTIDFTSAELDTIGKFIYIVQVAGILPYYGMVDIEEYTNADIGAKQLNIEDDIHGISGILPADPASETNVNAVADEVWVAGGRSLTAPNDYKADVSALAIEANIQGYATAALTAYNPPTRAEATLDKDAIITEIDINEAKIDSIQTKTDNLPIDPASETNVNAVEEGVDYISGALETGNISGISELISGVAELNDSIDSLSGYLDNIEINLTTTI